MSTESKKADIREYQVRAGSTDTFGRLLCSSRHHHFVVDGPLQNGCPGEALTPPEIFLAGVVTCGVELVQVFARDKNLALGSATGTISATLDRSNQSRSDVTLFNSVRLDFALTGVSHDEGNELVRAFQARCPLYGTLAVATPNLEVNVSTQE
ncbi:MAG: OsmC family protein [Chthoniobacterales bacterium]